MKLPGRIESDDPRFGVDGVTVTEDEYVAAGGLPIATMRERLLHRRDGEHLSRREQAALGAYLASLLHSVSGR